jgi:hypothetical protein
MNKQQKFQQKYKEYNKFLKSIGQKPITEKEYEGILYGRNKIKNVNGIKLDKYKLPDYGSVGMSKTVTVSQSACAKPEKKVYTGDKLIGIAVMHKSNLVPIFSTQEAEEVAKMRRG